MNPDFEIVEKLFSTALEFEGQERIDFLNSSCPAHLRSEIDSLLAAHEDAAPSFADKAQSIGSMFSVFLGERLSGESIGPFELQEMLGRGGMGVVYRAVHKVSGQIVAVKLISAHQRDRAARSRFERETSLVRDIHHPNVARVLDFGEAAGFLYVAMELIEGETLRDKLSAAPLGIATALNYAAQLAAALQVLHQEGISHHDLKPENLIISSEGVLKVVDFGLARQTPRLPKPSDSQLSPMLGGTIQYLAPEQVKGEPHSTPADIFAYGAILYEMLSGQRAFARSTPLLSAAAIVADQPVPLDGSCPAAAAQLVARCLQKKPAKRPSAAQLVNVVRSLPQSPNLATTRIIRNGVLFGAALALLALLAAAWNRISTSDSQLFLSGWQSAGSSPIEDVFEPAVSWDGRYLAFTGLNPSTQEKDIWITPAERWLPEKIVSNADSPSLSPDGRHLAYRSQNRLFLLDRQSGKARPFATGALRPRISPDGRFVAFWYGQPQSNDPLPAPSGSIHIVSLQGGSAIRLAASVSQAALPIWSPDSTHLLFVQRQAQRCQFWVAPISGEIPRPLDGFCPGGSEPLAWREKRIAGRIHPEFIFQARQDKGNALYLLSLEGRAKLRLLSAPGDSVRSCTVDRSGSIYAATQRNRPEVWSLALQSPEKAHPIATPAMAARAPSIDRTGQRLAFETGGSSVGTHCVLVDLAASQSEERPGGCFLSAAGNLIPSSKLIWDASPVGDELLLPTADAPFGIAWEKRQPAPSPAQSKVILRHPELSLYLATLSPDQRWVAFTAESAAKAPRIFVAPYRGAIEVPPSDWLDFANGDYPRWTPSGELLYLATAAGIPPMLMLQRWDARLRQPVGAPSPVPQFAAARFAVANLPPSTFRLSASRSRVVFTAASPHGRIFRAEEINANPVSRFSPKKFISSAGGFFMNNIQKALLILGLGLRSTQAATLYDLRSDFSSTNNPNGVWSLTHGTMLIPAAPAPGSIANNFHLAVANGLFGNVSTAPFVLQATVNGSATGPGNYTDNDFLSGDILAHSDTIAGDPEVFIRWTAPQAGTILNYSGAAWYAHSVVNRSNDFFVNFNGGPNLNSGTVAAANNRANQILFNSTAAIAVNAGDVLSLRLSATAGQSFGTISGLNFSVNFEPPPTTSGVPEPSTLALAGMALAGVIWFRRRA